MTDDKYVWTSRITTVEPDSLRTHGIDQSEIIRNFSYQDTVFFLLKGREPSKVESELLRAVLVSHVSHGITGQSTLAVRMAADCRSNFLHALVAGFSTGAGVYHQGGLQAAMLDLQTFVKLERQKLKEIVWRRLRKGPRLMGFGHRYYKHSEPRAALLLQIADEQGFSGPHLETARAVEEILRELKPLPMNIEAAGGAILLDIGIDPMIAHLFIILGRSPMFAAAYLERLAEGRPPFQKLAVSDIIEKNV